MTSSVKRGGGPGLFEQPGNVPVPQSLVRLRLAGPLAVATAAATSVTLLAPGLLSGTAVMNGSAKGTALVALAVGVPILTVAARRARRGSVRALAVTTGVAAYLVYNAVMFAFATPFNPAFLLYEAMLGLGIATLVTTGAALLDRAVDLDLAAPRWVAAYLWVVVSLNTAVWLWSVLPALVDDRPTQWLDGTGLTTNPVIVQDLAVWLPLMAWLGWGVWRNRAGPAALAAAGTVFWVIESTGVAVDQAWGHAADPASPWASAGAVLLFAVLALVGVLPALTMLRALPDRRRG
jgi:hypothetical protein